MLSPAFILTRGRIRRARLGAFAAYIAAPHNLTASFIMPIGAKLYASVAALQAAPLLLCTVNGVNRYIPPVAANEIVPLGYFEKQATLTLVYVASTARLYIDNWGVKSKFAERIV